MNRITRLALLAGATVVAALGVVACGDDAVGKLSPSGAGGAGNTSESTARDGVAVPAAASATSAAAAYAPSGDSPDPAVAAEFDRKIIFNANLSLEAHDVTSTFNLASRLATNAGGFVDKSSFNGGDGPDASAQRFASLTLRVPAPQYQAVLAGLRAMDGVTVKQENSSSNEVTEQYTDLQSRLRNLQTTEDQYLGLLAQAKTVDDILKLTDRVNAVRDQLDQTQGRINLLDHLTDLATIDVSIAPIVVAKTEPPKQDGPKSVGEAFADAWNGSLDAARYAASAGAVLAVVGLWLVLPLAAILLAGRQLRRRFTPSRPA